MAKRNGRPRKNYRAENGKEIDGLGRTADGRWKVIGTSIRFSEPNEAKAIEKFRKLTSSPSRQKYHDHLRADLVPQLANLLTLPEAWPEIAAFILARPKWVAQHSGLAELGYLTDVKPPAPLPSFATLEKLWSDHATVLPEERRKVIAAWRDFISTAKVASLRDITPENVVEFRDAVWSRGLSGKTQQHLFNRVRRLLSFAANERAVAVKACREALDYLKLLKPKGATVVLDPRPIEPGEFTALLDKATGDDRTMLLLGLNCALHQQEVIDLRWSDIQNGCLVSNRRKTGNCLRVSVLWRETLEALAQVKRQGERIFYSYQGSPLTVSGACKRWRKLRTAAKVETVVFDQLRDGALTAAAAANINSQLCDLLAGHRTGIKDHYVKRNPKMVAPACAAIYHEYFSQPKQGKESETVAA